MNIIFDIGHGTDTYPKRGKGIKKPNGQVFEEHDFNSAVAIKTKEIAEKQGFNIIFSQQPFSKEICLEERVEKINLMDNIDLIISFHANAATTSKPTGYGIFYYFNDNKMLEFCKKWKKQAAKILDIKPWGTGIWKCVPGTWSNFFIVKNTKAPCVLIEHFFFTNIKELEKCNTEEYIAKFAEVTVRTICDYFNKDYINNKEDTQIQRETQIQVDVNDKIIELGSFVIKNKNYVSLREVFEKTGNEVKWQGNDKPIKIIKKGEKL